MEEIYKVIEGFENYSVSNLGNVKNNTTDYIMKLDGVNNNYFKITLRNDKQVRKFFVHRLVALAFIDNFEDKPEVDHIDTDGKNNILSNLRWATKKQNGQNKKIANNNKSGTKGVHFDKPRNKWRSYINIDGIQIYLGYFVDKQDAINARVQRANEAFGIYTNKCEKIINV